MAPSLLQSLPADIRKAVMQLLDTRALIHFAHTCRDVKNDAMDERCWVFQGRFSVAFNDLHTMTGFSRFRTYLSVWTPPGKLQVGYWSPRHGSEPFAHQFQYIGQMMPNLRHLNLAGLGPLQFGQVEDLLRSLPSTLRVLELEVMLVGVQSPQQSETLTLLRTRLPTYVQLTLHVGEYINDDMLAMLPMLHSLTALNLPEKRNYSATGLLQLTRCSRLCSLDLPPSGSRCLISCFQRFFRSPWATTTLQQLTLSRGRHNWSEMTMDGLAVLSRLLSLRDFAVLTHIPKLHPGLSLWHEVLPLLVHAASDLETLTLPCESEAPFGIVTCPAFIAGSVLLPQRLRRVTLLTHYSMLVSNCNIVRQQLSSMHPRITFITKMIMT